MVAKRSTLLVAVVCAVAFALAPTAAEARFGKRSSSGGGSTGSNYHGTSAGGRATYYSPYYYAGYRYWPSFVYGASFGYYPYFGYYPPYYYYPYAYPVPEQPIVGQQAPRPTIKTTISAEGQTFGSFDGRYHSQSGGGGTFGAKLGLEGQRLGFNAQFTAIFAPRDDTFASSRTDTISLFNLYATYALIASPHGRLRIEAGLTSAFAPDLTVAGPGGGFSAVIYLGPLGIEGAIHGTPFPYRQLDWNAGLALNLGPIGLHGGWRRIFLDDRGLVDNVIHKDTFSGPYLGVGVTL